MDKRVEIPWLGGRNTMGRGVKIPWIRGLKYHGYGVEIPWVGGRYTMVRESKYHGSQNTI